MDKDDDLDNQLNLIKYQTKKDRIRSILKNPNPVATKDNSIKNGRLWLVGFLNYVGYSEQEILNIIKNHNNWSDYQTEETGRQVHWLVNRKVQSPSTEKIQTPEVQNTFVFTQEAEEAENGNNDESKEVKSEDIINLFFSTCKPININPPSDINKAVLYYHNMGFHIIPKIKDKKRPAVRWKIYQDNQPPLFLIKRWDFSNGIILLGTKKHSFLDIDLKSRYHGEGLENFDESRLKGWYYERTQNGGYHIFGLGFFPKGMSGLINNAVQIKHVGGYIVAYPTLGYTKYQIGII